MPHPNCGKSVLIRTTDWHTGRVIQQRLKGCLLRLPSLPTALLGWQTILQGKRLIADTTGMHHIPSYTALPHPGITVSPSQMFDFLSARGISVALTIVTVLSGSWSSRYIKSTNAKMCDSSASVFLTSATAPPIHVLTTSSFACWLARDRTPNEPVNRLW